MKFLQLLFLIFLVIAVLVRVFLAFAFQPNLKPNQNVSFITTLLTEPTNYGTYQKVNVQYITRFSSQSLGLILKPDQIYHYGDTIAISGKIQVSKSPSKALVLYHPQVQLITKKQNILLSISYFLRQKIQNQYSEVLPEKSAELLLGILLGYKANFPVPFLRQLQATGMVHVLAAEGLNVILAAEFLLALCNLFLKRRWAIAFTIMGLLFYCILCGLQASIVRSTIMMGLALCAQFFGRQYSRLYGLLLAAVCMLLYNPTWITDVGFQLSFAATLGIFFIKPLLPPWGIFADDVSTTISAQIATLPILLGTFGSYGLLSILVNALLLWTIPLLMILGGIGGLLGILFAPLGNLVIWTSEPILWFFESVVGYFANFGWQITLTTVPALMVVGYYLIAGSMVIILRGNHKQ